MYLPKILLFVLLIVANTLTAVQFDVNKTSILVEDTDANDPIKLKQAFAQIVANNTGENIKQVLQNPVFATTNIEAGIKHAYFERIETRYLAKKSKYKYWFYLVMQDGFIKSIIKQAGFSVMPNNREKILLWAATETTKAIYAYNDKVAFYWINHWAITLGLNIVLPKIDKVDMAAVTPFSIKTLSFQAHNHSQFKYNINHSLLLAYKKSSGLLKIRSGFQSNNDTMTIRYYQNKNLDFGEILYAVLSEVSQKYADKYRINPNNLQTHTVQVVINSLRGYDDVNLVNKYLNSLSIIDSYTVVAAAIGQMVLTMNLSITSEAFLQLIARDNVLSQANNISINQLILNYNIDQ